MEAASGKPLLILGARSFASEVADLVRDLPEWKLEAFVENLDPARCREFLDGLPVRWIDELASLANTHWGICALGSNRRIDFIRRAAGYGMRFASLIHPSARVSTTSRCGAGTLVSPGAHVASHCLVGDHVIVGRGALIGHGVEIGEAVTIAPGANLAGRCRVQPGSYIGMGAILLENTCVGAGSVIAAGSVVSGAVPDHVMMAGMPAVIVKHGIDGL